MSSFFLYVLRFFLPPEYCFLQSNPGKDGVHPNLSPAEIDDVIELLNIKLDHRHLHVELVLITIVVISGEVTPTTGSTGAA